jgi:enoyl-CoA hydratase/carnithine racemase
MSTVITEVREYTLWARINRPDAHNAIDFEVMEELENIVERLEEDDSIRVFILSGAGSESFISGGDLRKFHQLTTEEEAEKMSRRMHRLLKRIEELPCWTVACINGQAFGGGIEIALAFDFRIASRSVRIGFTQARFYLPPGWGGLTRLVETVGRSKALEWLAEAAVIDVMEAHKSGFVNRTEDSAKLEAATWKWADRLSKNDRPFIENLKTRAQYILQIRNEALRAEIGPFAQFWTDERHQQRVEKFLNRKSDTE